LFRGCGYPGTGEGCPVIRILLVGRRGAAWLSVEEPVLGIASAGGEKPAAE
jgi:hypothetical protein